MLVYLATYPRSGNSLIQRTLAQNFGRLSSQIKVSRKPGDGFPRLEGWDIRRAAWAASDSAGALWSDHTLVYRNPKEPGAAWRRGLSFVPPDFFTDEVRQALASANDLFCIKTHHLPFDRYFGGESVIQIVRHPGAAIWSYFRLLATQALARQGRRLFDRPPVTLDRVIAGQIQFGGWDAYHGHWAPAAAGLGDRYRLFHFRQIVEDQAGFRRSLSRFLDLPVLDDAPVIFEGYRNRHPTLAPRGTDDGYERFYSRRQLELMWRTNSAVAERYGYAAPDLNAADARDQPEILNELIELAWRNGRPG